MTDFRIEHDSLGDIAVPASARWGAQTQRAVENFAVSGERVPPGLVQALAAIKAAAAEANAELGVLPADLAEAIAGAADEIAAGGHGDQFPVDVFQTGSGTSTNMNVNEVIASLAAERLGRPVHPNDHVNASQSSNDVFPTAVHLAALRAIGHRLLPSLELLAMALRDKAEEFAGVVKSGRTHLMDAVPVTLGQEFGGYAAAIERGMERVRAAVRDAAEVPLGGTAVGTGLNAPAGFAERVLVKVSNRLQVEAVEARDHFEAQGARDALVHTSAALRTVAVSLNKIASDLRWMNSGPAAGLAEIHLPDLQPGSSIMPGKVNPVVPEAVHQVVAQVIGNDATIAFAGATGNFELNVMVPVIARNVLQSIDLLANVTELLARRCVAGVEADAERCRRYALSSPSLATALNPYIGYDVAARVVKRAIAEGRTVREIVLDEDLLDETRLDEALDLLAMTRGGLR
ncbi:MAG: class II fumarate hydratase [Acidimicrobiia bacterium]